MTRPLAMAMALALSAALPAPAQDSKVRSGIAAWDTGRASPEPLPLADRTGWTELAAESALKGDAVLTNGRVTLVVRRQSAAAELHGAGGLLRSRLVLLSETGEPAERLERVALPELGKGSGALDVVYKTAKGTEIAARLRLKRGETSVEAEPAAGAGAGAGAGRLRIECPARFAVLPDFFADDLMIDASKVAAAAIDLPSETIVLHLAAKGEAIAACVFENREQEVRVTLAGEGDRREITGTEIRFGKGRKVWLALLEGAGIWHALEVRDKDAGKILPLEWTMPFPAAWRVDFTRSTELTDSWEMLLQEKEEGSYVKPSWLGSGSERIKPNRKRWTTVLGDFPYPCWSDPGMKGYVQPLKKEAARFQGPAVLYPINRVSRTPLEAFTIVDVMRATLGVGPCQYILDLDGQKEAHKGHGGCDTRDKLNEIYGKGEQKAKRAEIEQALKDVHVCISYINGRILHYLEFAKGMHEYLAEQKKARPELAGFAGEMDAIVAAIDARWAERSGKIRTPDFILKLGEEFRKEMLDADGPDALERCKKYTRSIVEVADNQDEMLGECRWAVRAMRQRAGLAMAKDPKVAPLATEVRAKAQESMRNPASLEGARH